VLNFSVAVLLFRACPDADEGELTRRRAALVSGRSLAAVAAELELGRQLKLGGGELKSGGARRESILADALEAVVGAVYLDGGTESASEVIAMLFGARLEALPHVQQLKDAKTQLQERLQARGLPLPAYMIEEVGGEPHERRFVASCEVTALGLRTHGEGSSRRRAEQAAAEGVLAMLPPEVDPR
jgi:ribonuclease-3